MAFKFGGPEFPLSLKITRSLTYVQVVILGFAALVFLAVNATSNGGSVQIGNDVSGSGLLGLALMFAAAAIVLIYLATMLGKTQQWTRIAFIVVEALIVGFYALHIDSDWTSTALMGCICAGIVYTLFAPGARMAFAKTAAGETTADTDPLVPSEETNPS